MSLGDGLTWADWVRLTASDLGVHGLTEDNIEFLLWECTAWPIATDLAVLGPQLTDALLGVPLPCPCCGQPLGADGRVGVCAACASGHGW